MKIGTRGSELALWQAHFTHDLLKQTTGIDAEIITIKTAGDRDLVTPLPEMSGKGFFTKEIEEALLDGRIDLAVHSLKDLQTQMPPGLEIGAIPARADRRDVLLIRPEAYERAKPLRLRENVHVGTSSARRVAQLRFLRPDLEVESLRGNVPTRVRKLRERRYDAILVAAAGLDRLQLALDDLIAYRLPEQVIVPAPGQGALAVQVRAGDAKTGAQVAHLDQPSLRRLVGIEREILKRLEGGCQLALGTAADETESGLRLAVFLGTDDPKRPRRVVVAGREFDPVVASAVDYLKGVPKPRSEEGPVSVWITREPQRAEEFRRLCDEHRFKVSAIPVFMAIEAGSPVEQDEVMKRLASYDWVFFTSQVTVTEFDRLMERHEARFGPKTRLAAVGRKTRNAMERQGWKVDFTADVADARALGEQFQADAHGKIGRVLFPCGAAASGDLDIALAEGCTAFDRLVCYDTVEHPQLQETVAALPDPEAVVFTSPQAAQFLLARRSMPLGTSVVSIGPATTDELLRSESSAGRAGFPIVYEAFERSMEGTAEVINGLFPVASPAPSAA